MSGAGCADAPRPAPAEVPDVEKVAVETHAWSDSSEGRTADESVKGAETSDVADLLAENITDAERRHVLHKLDMLLLPLASGCVLLQMLDKTLLNYAAMIDGFFEDTHVNHSQFSWLGSIFYFGYMAGTPLNAYLLQRLPLSPYISVIVVLWGMVLACHSAALSFSSFMAVRFFLGFLEAAINPGFIMLTGRFYTRTEQVVRVAIWYSMNGMAMIVGGSMTYGIIVNPAPTIARWKELFVGVGIVTVCFGFLCYFIMPSTPDATRYLTPRQRKIAVMRVASNKTGIHDSQWKWYQFFEAFLDVRLYLFFIAFASVNVTNGGISIYATQLINSFGYDTAMSSLLDMCKGAAEVVAVFIGTGIYLLIFRRDVPSVFGYVVAIVGGVMMTKLGEDQREARVAGISLVYFFPISYPLFYSWMSTAVAGTTKRMIFNSTLQIAYCVGNILGPQVYSGPTYDTAITIDYIMFAVSAVFTILLTLVHYLWNRARDRHGANESVDQVKQLENDLSDLTDKERPTFRYPF